MRQRMYKLFPMITFEIYKLISLITVEIRSNVCFATGNYEYLDNT